MKWLHDMLNKMAKNPARTYGDSRGHPFHIDPTHYRVHSPSVSDSSREEPLCGNGSWHVWWTKNWDIVTCRHCLDKKDEVQ